MTHPVEGSTETVTEQTAAGGQNTSQGIQREEALGGVVADQLVTNVLLKCPNRGTLRTLVRSGGRGHRHSKAPQQ